MGLAALLTRSDAGLPTSAPVDPAPGGARPSEGLPDELWATSPRSTQLPAPTERSALSVPAFWRGHAYVCGGLGLLPVSAWRGNEELNPQPSVLIQPDPNQTPMAFWAETTSALTLYGNSFAIITATDRLGWPTALHPVHPLYAAVRFGGNPSSPLVSGWYLSGQFYDPSQVWHVKSHLGQTGWPLGRGLLDGVGDGIASTIALQAYGSSYFAGGGMPNGVLKIHRPEITQDQADEAKANWVKRFAGRSSVAVLNELTDFTPVAFRPVDSQMIESRQLSLTEVALMWGLPPTKLGANVGGATYRNAEMEEIQARNDALVPWATLLEQAIGLSLIPRGQRAQWNMDAKLRADTLSRFQAYQLALGGPGPTSAWMLSDEVRDLESLDPMSEAMAALAAMALADAQTPNALDQPVSALTSGGQ